MKRQALFVVVSALCLVFVGSSFAKAGIYDGLSPKDQAVIQSGKQIVRTADATGYPWPAAWPKVTVIQRVDATAEELMAVFLDYDHHKDFTPRITQSHVSRQIDPTHAEVSYTMSIGNLPGGIFPDENYTSINTISTYDNGSAYQIEWKFKEADHVKWIEGKLQVEPLGTGAIVSYYSLIIPHEPGLASLVSRLAISQIRDAVANLGKLVVTERTQAQTRLQAQLAVLRRAVEFERQHR